MSAVGDKEVMTPVPTSQALQHIEITVLRQLGENIAAQTRHLETLSTKVDDVRERVIRIEALQTDKQIEELKSRVTMLEDTSNQARGVASFAAWLAQSAPWLLAGIAAAIAFMRNK